MKVKFRCTAPSMEHEVLDTIGNYYILNIHPTNWPKACFIAADKDSVDIVPDEPVYHVGQRFNVGSQSNDLILASVGPRNGDSLVVLIDLKTGWHWTMPQPVKCTSRITKAELYSLTVRQDYKVID